MDQLPADSFGSELQQSVLEANSLPWVRLADLAENVASLRRAAIAVAQPLGLGIVAAGTVPIADPDLLKITPDARYEHMQGEYRMLVREQLICGVQVHVDVPDPIWPSLSRTGWRPGCRPCWRCRRARPSGWAWTPATPATAP